MTAEQVRQMPAGEELDRVYWSIVHGYDDEGLELIACNDKDRVSSDPAVATAEMEKWDTNLPSNVRLAKRSGIPDQLWRCDLDRPFAYQSYVGVGTTWMHSFCIAMIVAKIEGSR